jgi:hypothetical protein
MNGTSRTPADALVQIEVRAIAMEHREDCAWVTSSNVCDCGRNAIIQAAQPKVWRAGDRIRDDGGTGYGDAVSDGEIWRHVASSVAKKDVAHIEFAMAVLRYRAAEREAGHRV